MPSGFLAVFAGVASLTTLQRLAAAVPGFAEDPAARHAAFMLLQAAAGQPATLFRETDEEDAAAAGVFSSYRASSHC
jgi:hypothetical protein